MQGPLLPLFEYGWKEVSRPPRAVVRAMKSRGVFFSNHPRSREIWMRIPLTDLLTRVVEHALVRSGQPPGSQEHRLMPQIWMQRFRLYQSESGIQDVMSGAGIPQLERVFSDLHAEELKAYPAWRGCRDMGFAVNLVVNPESKRTAYLRLHLSPLG